VIVNFFINFVKYFYIINQRKYSNTNVQKFMLMVRKIVLSIVAVLSVCAMAMAQNLKVSGTVVDSAGAPIVGATVVIDGTNTGVTTNVDGLFTINAPRNGKLVVSSLGFEEKIVEIA
jgi:hypothetical protein